MKAGVRFNPVFFSIVLLCLFSNRMNGQPFKMEFYKFSSAIYDGIKKDSAMWRGGITSTDLSFIGRYKEALLEMDKARPYRQAISSADSIAFVTTFRPTDAVEYILRAARQQQVLIFNEAHYNPRHRVFVTSLLKRLKGLGFTYFAAETLSNPQYGNLKHPDLSTGSYAAEPQFGNMLREAVALGYTLYPYEDTTGASGKMREIGEARNLQTLLKQHPEAKIIIYCGYAHIYEDAYEPWGKAMAGRLTEYTGIDPYTIDQVELTEKGNKDLENPYYKLVQARGYSILTDKQGRPFNKRLDGQHVEALLYTPHTRYVHNRPGWIFENGKVPYFLNPHDITLTYPVLVKAYAELDNMETAVPVDVVESRSREEVSTTALALFPKSSFKVKLESQNGETQTIVIKNSSR